jgi:flagellin
LEDVALLHLQFPDRFIRLIRRAVHGKGCEYQYKKRDFIMSIVINTNMQALISRDHLIKATADMNKSVERLSTGLRINHAKDDPAGCYQATTMQTQIRGVQAAYQNVANASSLLSVAEGDLKIINDHLERIKDLATQYANDTLSTAEQNAIKEEVRQRVEEIDRIATESDFNKLKLLDGSRESLRVQIGGNSDPTTNALIVTGVLKKASTGEDGLNLFSSTGFADVAAAFQNASTASQFIDVVEASTEDVALRISTAGIYQNRLSSISNLLMIENENLTAAHSTIVDADIATETAKYVQTQILQQTTAVMLAQANQAPGAIALQLLAEL